MLKAIFHNNRAQCEAASAGVDRPSVTPPQMEVEAAESSGGRGRSSLSMIFTGWATLLTGSVIYSLMNKKNETMRLSQRVIHGRIHAQGVTLAALGLAAGFELFTNTGAPSSRQKQENRNVEVVVPVKHTQ